MNDKKFSEHKITKKDVCGFIVRYAIITLGCVIYSLGVSLFLDANNFASGGITGVAIIINYIIKAASGFDFSTGILIIILNVPIFVLGAIYFGKKFIISTAYATVMSSALMYLWEFVFESYLPITESMLLAALVGGAMFGIGLGFIFRMGSSTGGTDIIVKICRKKFRYLRMGFISLIIDMSIVLTSAIVYWAFGMENFFENTCYTAISIVVFTTLFDLVLYGGNTAKLAYIITTHDKAPEITSKILAELDIGATFIDGEGAYTGNEKRIILCAVKNYLFPKLKDIVKAHDPNAFVIVTSAKEIYGEGYLGHFDDEL